MTKLDYLNQQFMPFEVRNPATTGNVQTGSAHVLIKVVLLNHSNQTALSVFLKEKLGFYLISHVIEISRVFYP